MLTMRDSGVNQPMAEPLANARDKFLRDSHLPWSVLARKSFRYALGLLTARIYLRGVTARGKGARTIGRPRIDNLGVMRIGDHVMIRSVNVPVELCTGPAGTLEIGNQVHFNYGTSIGAMGRIVIGDRVRFGPYAMVIDTEFHDAYDRERMPEPRPVVIEEDAWIGAKASILPGVRVGRGAIVGVSSVVTADVPPASVVVGVPARAVRALDPGRLAGRKGP